MTLQIDYKSSLLGPTLTPVGIWRPLVAAGTIRTGEERKVLYRSSGVDSPRKLLVVYFISTNQSVSDEVQNQTTSKHHQLTLCSLI